MIHSLARPLEMCGSQSTVLVCDGNGVSWFTVDGVVLVEMCGETGSVVIREKYWARTEQTKANHSQRPNTRMWRSWVSWVDNIRMTGLVVLVCPV